MAEEVKTLPQEKKSAAINELGINLAERNEWHFPPAASHACIAWVKSPGLSWIIHPFFFVYC
jgi:hypothetical protein